MSSNSLNQIGGETIVNIPDANAGAGASGMASDSNQEEGVLRDVLDQLDRERSKRAELEAQIRKLTDELATERAKAPPQTEVAVTEKAFLAMETQVQGYQELVDAITLGKPAIAAAAAQAAMSVSDTTKRQQTLPLHAVRLLEVMPWDPRAAEHIYGYEEVYEWQIYDARENRWHNNFQSFPSLFKGLPVVKPNGNGEKIAENSSKDRSLLVFLAGGDKSTSPSKHGVLTNEKITHIYKIEDGYPLPHDGGRWEWIGGWRIDSRINKAAGGQDNLLCDEHGWCYAADPTHFLASASSSSLAGNSVGPSREDGASGPKRNVRRRKWSRRRVLIDYPLASERTQKYLEKLVENARLTVTAAKLSDQLVQTKMALTEAEENLVKAKAALQNQDGVVRSVAVASTEAAALSSDDKTDESVGSLQDFLPKNDQVREFGSKITQWVKTARKTSEDLTSVESGEDDTALSRASEDGGSQKFPWKKLGRGALLEKLARPSPGSGKSSTHGRANSNGSNTLATSPTTGVEEVSFTKKDPP